MDVYEPQRERKRRKARERQALRKNRQQAVAKPRATAPPQQRHPRRWQLPPPLLQAMERAKLPGIDGQSLQGAVNQARVALGDSWWHLRNNPKVLRWAAVALVAAVIFYFLSFIFTGRVFPNVRSLGVSLGGMSITEAEGALRAAWRNEVLIDLVVDGEKIAQAAPESLGLRLDARQTAEDARSQRLGALPFGKRISPVLSLHELSVQNYLLDVADEVNTMPYEAGYSWENGQVVGVPGRNGRLLDVPLTMLQLEQDLEFIVERRRIELLTVPIPPDVRDPTPFLAEVEKLVAQEFKLTGYDPYTNRYYHWPVAPALLTSWLAAAPRSLTLRDGALRQFIDAVNDTLNTDISQNEEVRFISEEESRTLINAAIAGGDATQIGLRVRYRAAQYSVVSGDTGYRISRKTGIPFYLIQQANTGIVWEALSIGQTINLPSRDLTMPELPVGDKRIIVDLDRQYLMAFENGQVVFEWPISSGRAGAPTAPGIFQILNHDPVARGSSNTLCDAAGLVCGLWEMNWFMGIYEVIPGLVNGFHGAVLLPNGAYLDGGNGYPTTFGCIMSNDDLAKQLYDWAEVGTVVEIINREFAPMSDLGQIARNSV